MTKVVPAVFPDRENCAINQENCIIRKINKGDSYLITAAQTDMWNKHNFSDFVNIFTRYSGYTVVFAY